MEQIRINGSSRYLHFYDEAKRATLCGLPIVGRVERQHAKHTGDGSTCTCPLCQGAALRERTVLATNESDSVEAVLSAEKQFSESAIDSVVASALAAPAQSASTPAEGSVDIEV